MNLVWRPCDNAVLTVQQPHMESDCLRNQSELLKLIMGDKENGVVIFNTKNNKEKHEHTYSKRVRADS